jgi:uncharacterized membrane protein YhaH (DUF805 family)
MELEPIFKYGWPVVTTLAVGLLGRTRRIGFWGSIIVSILLTPFGGFVIAILSGPKRIHEDHLGSYDQA